MHDPRPERILRTAVILGALTVLLLPAARGSSDWFGFLPLWLLGMPLAAWWSVSGFPCRGSRPRLPSSPRAGATRDHAHALRVGLRASVAGPPQREHAMRQTRFLLVLMAGLPRRRSPPMPRRSPPCPPPTIPTSGWRTSPATSRWPGSANGCAHRCGTGVHARLRRVAGADRGDPRFQGEDPRRREDRRVLLQLLEGRAAPARAVAAHHAGRIPQARATVGNGDRPRRARRRRARETGSGTAPTACAKTTAATGAAWSRSRAAAPMPTSPRIRPRRQDWVRGGFFRPEAKGGLSWIDRDHVYVGTDFGPGSMTTSGYARIAKRWTRGTPMSAATTVYEGKPDDLAVGAFRDRTPGFERDFVDRTIAFWNDELFLRGKDGTLTKIDAPNSAGKGHPSRMADAAAARTVVGRWPRLSRRRAARDEVRRLHGRQARLRGAVHAQRHNLARGFHVDQGQGWC